MGMSDAELASRKAQLNPITKRRLETWPIDRQKKWMANPGLEYIIVDFERRLWEAIRARTGGVHPVTTINSIVDTVIEEKPEPSDDDVPIIFGDDGTGFDLFD